MGETVAGGGRLETPLCVDLVAVPIREMGASDR